jgi:hypothetical protein
VDISGAGINRKPDIVGTRTVYIKNSINMGGLLDFDREFMDDYTIKIKKGVWCHSAFYPINEAIPLP